MGLLVDFDQVFGLDEVESFWTLLFERKKEKKRNEAKREESLSKQTGWSSSEVVKTAKRPLKGYEDLSTMNRDAIEHWHSLSVLVYIDLPEWFTKIATGVEKSRR